MAVQKKHKARNFIKEAENGIQNAICDYLALKHYVFWRQNTIPVFDMKTNSYRKMPRYSMNGVSDIILLTNGTAFFLEVKALAGKQDEDQIEFERLVNKAGCHYAVVRSLEDVINLGL